jgi:vacuolar protein sorting-associated protein 26
MSAFFFSTPVDIDIVLEDTDDRQTVDVKLDKNRREKAPLYFDGESVKGAVTIRPKDGKRLEHTGIKVQFIGLIGTVARIRTARDAAADSASYRDVL